ncbi:hypothetical protein [Arenibacter lacus]|uniref:hypothetical protein n=1 Tax=Arenibacter lacus TaxID=2608629 RepID=UPI00123CF4F5|nr:hypothetical protein [Arenibacter lacus]
MEYNNEWILGYRHHNLQKGNAMIRANKWDVKDVYLRGKMLTSTISFIAKLKYGNFTVNTS